MPMVNPIPINESDLVGLINSTSMSETFINVNQTVYGGLLFFLLLLGFYIILFLGFQRKENQILPNMMYAGAITTVISFMYRIVQITVNGVIKGMLTDTQMWLFPILTSFLAMILWINKRY